MARTHDQFPEDAADRDCQVGRAFGGSAAEAFNTAVHGYLDRDACRPPDAPHSVTRREREQRWAATMTVTPLRAARRSAVRCVRRARQARLLSALDLAAVMRACPTENRRHGEYGSSAGWYSTDDRAADRSMWSAEPSVQAHTGWRDCRSLAY